MSDTRKKHEELKRLPTQQTLCTNDFPYKKAWQTRFPKFLFIDTCRMDLDFNLKPISSLLKTSAGSLYKLGTNQIKSNLSFPKEISKIIFLNIVTNMHFS